MKIQSASLVKSKFSQKYSKKKFKWNQTLSPEPEDRKVLGLTPGVHVAEKIPYAEHLLFRYDKCLAYIKETKNAWRTNFIFCYV